MIACASIAFKVATTATCFFNVERNIAYKVASDATSKVTTAKTRHILLIKTTVASSFQKDS